ncbi:hypothetical protein NL521_28375, partial [Klebsiella pneumoniae]|nr:hypothetical protein [Klebsiella pneumoniae]
LEDVRIEGQHQEAGKLSDYGRRTVDGGMFEYLATQAHASISVPADRQCARHLETTSMSIPFDT